ncbi:MAG: hypothetical protein EBR02_08165 [Alphaproteobacteria bacterium]|nr:hypothetical protein [Alphaproteobacteria bacterium]
MLSLRRDGFYTYSALLLCFLFVLSRHPQMLWHPQFVGEEAGFYYPYARTHDWLSVLLKPHFGYFSLLDNLVMLAASRLTSSLYAPFFTVYTALIIDFIPCMIIWLGQSTCWPDRRSKILASAIILLVGQTSEIWFSIVSAQFYLCLATFLLLAEEWEARSKRCILLYSGLLVLAAFTGVVSCFLTPLFIWRAWRGSPVALLFASIMIVACIVHAGVTFWLFEHGEMTQRFVLHSLPAYITNFALNFFIAIFPGLFSFLMPPLLGLIGCLLKSVFQVDNKRRLFVTIVFLYITFLAGLYNYYFMKVFDNRIDWQQSKISGALMESFA